MSGRYSATFLQTAVESTPGETIGQIFPSATTVRPALYYFTVSAGGTMTDVVMRVALERVSALGTEGAGVVPVAFDEGETASITDGGEDHSAEPTITAATEFWDQPVHLRATPQIQLQPDSHIIAPAVATSGLNIRSFSASYTGIAHAGFYFYE
jgi:hypothetical protein